jgi:hypothetical protein
VEGAAPQAEAPAPAEAPAEEVAAPQAEARCKAVLSTGERCSNLAKPGSDYCGIAAHQRQAATA